jgi:hypothetical protein
VLKYAPKEPLFLKDRIYLFKEKILSSQQSNISFSFYLRDRFAHQREGVVFFLPFTFVPRLPDMKINPFPSFSLYNQKALDFFEILLGLS